MFVVVQELDAFFQLSLHTKEMRKTLSLTYNVPQISNINTNAVNNIFTFKKLVHFSHHYRI